MNPEKTLFHCLIRVDLRIREEYYCYGHVRIFYPAINEQRMFAFVFHLAKIFSFYDRKVRISIFESYFSAIKRILNFSWNGWNGSIHLLNVHSCNEHGWWSSLITNVPFQIPTPSVITESNEHPKSTRCSKSNSLTIFMLKGLASENSKR